MVPRPGTIKQYYSTAKKYNTIAQFAITVNSNDCPHIRVPNTLMMESYA